MLGKVRPRRPSAAMVVAFLALCVALSGTAVGESAVTSAQKLITGKQIKNRSVTGVDIKSNSVTSGAIKNQSLLRADFKLGELPAGPAGAKGDVGPQGAKGDKGDPGANGSPDTPQQVLAKLEQVDGSGSGLDADTVDGTDATVLLQCAVIVGAQGRLNSSAQRHRGLTSRASQRTPARPSLRSASPTCRSPIFFSWNGNRPQRVESWTRSESAQVPIRRWRTPSATRPTLRSIRPKRISGS